MSVRPTSAIAIELVDQCPECKGTKLFFDHKRSELICRDCGFVVNEQVPVIEAEHNSRASRVLFNGREGKMAVVLSNQLKSKIERAMTVFYSEIKKLELIKPVEAEVIRLCRRCAEKKITMKASKVSLICASTYIVSRKMNIPVFFDEFQRVYGLSKKCVMKTCKILSRELGLKIVPNLSSSEYVLRICSDMGLSGEVVNESMKLLNKSVSCNPSVQAAASIYSACCNLHKIVVQRELARSARISLPTLRKNWYKVSQL